MGLNLIIGGVITAGVALLLFHYLAESAVAITKIVENTKATHRVVGKMPQLGIGGDAEDGENTYDLSPPPIRSANAASYCPICKSEYREGFSQCNSCQVELTPYDAAVHRLP